MSFPLSITHSSQERQAQAQAQAQGEGFSSAFDLISIDDPNNLLAGLASAESAPFFTEEAMGTEAGMDPDATPTPLPMSMEGQQPSVPQGRSQLEGTGIEIEIEMSRWVWRLWV